MNIEYKHLKLLYKSYEIEEKMNRIDKSIAFANEVYQQTLRKCNVQGKNHG